MADNFGLKIGVEGEKEFKKALAEINQNFKVLGSEMKLVSSQFDKNDKSVDALTARNKVLSKEIDEQKSKIELAIRREVVRMIDKQYSSLVSYKSAMALAKTMYIRGIITAEEYEIIETKMCEKFGINSCSIFRDNEWINTLFRGNMSDTKEEK